MVIGDNNETVDHVLNPLHAEVIAIPFGVQMAWERNLMHLI